MTTAEIADIEECIIEATGVSKMQNTVAIVTRKTKSNKIDDMDTEIVPAQQQPTSHEMYDSSDDECCDPQQANACLDEENEDAKTRQIEGDDSDDRIKAQASSKANADKMDVDVPAKPQKSRPSKASRSASSKARNPPANPVLAKKRMRLQELEGKYNTLPDRGSDFDGWIDELRHRWKIRLAARRVHFFGEKLFSTSFGTPSTTKKK